jgi:thymidylate kinase
MVEIMNGKLITFEGVDGSGKSTMLARLQSKNDLLPLCRAGTVFTREPTKETLTGKAVYAAIENRVDPLAELFLFLADHAAHLAETVRPAMENGKLVISDRYSDSRVAYQSVTLKETISNESAFDFIQKSHEPWTIKPDLTFFFDISPEVSCARCKDRGEQTKFERVDFLNEVRAAFKKLAENEPNRFVILDAEKTPEENEKIILDKIQELLKE